MIKIENVLIEGFEPAIRGMRNPMNSWEKSDSWFALHYTMNEDDKDYEFDSQEFIAGPNDLDLMQRLAKAGSEHAKYRRMIVVWLDITAPLYWWKEFDTYKVGTVSNSCSTMHKIADKEFELDDFSHEHLFTAYGCPGEPDIIDSIDVVINGTPVFESSQGFLIIICDVLNHYRKLYLETKDKKYWWQMIQLLPSSYNQKRTVMLNYEVLAKVYRERKDHKLDEWRSFCDWIKTLPYAKEIILCDEKPIEDDIPVCFTIDGTVYKVRYGDLRKAIDDAVKHGDTTTIPVCFTSDDRAYKVRSGELRKAIDDAVKHGKATEVKRI